MASTYPNVNQEGEIRQAPCLNLYERFTKNLRDRFMKRTPQRTLGRKREPISRTIELIHRSYPSISCTNPKSVTPRESFGRAKICKLPVRVLLSQGQPFPPRETPNSRLRHASAVSPWRLPDTSIRSKGGSSSLACKRRSRTSLCAYQRATNYSTLTCLGHVGVCDPGVGQ